jgi:adenylate kinase
MDRGDLVPDDLILAMMEGEMDRASGGLLLDGFPRTVGQAEAFDKILERKQRSARVILFDIDLDVVAERLSGRWTNPRSGRVYHEKHAPPLVAGIDDEDGGALMQREDDKPETIRKRLAIYGEQTKPLVAYYQQRGCLRRIDAAQPMDAVTHAIEAVLHPPEGDRAA